MEMSLIGEHGLLALLRSKDESLFYDVIKIRERAEPLLAKITESFPEFTLHDIRHSNKVLEILEWIIPLQLQNQFNKFELLFLIASCFLHDIGMVNFPELIDDIIKDATDVQRIQKYLRNNHHLRSEAFIVDNYQRLGLNDEHQARIIGRICRGHREMLDNKSLYNNREMYGSQNISINVPLLAAFLQLADDLDLTFERTPVIIFETIKPTNKISLQEWERHLATCGVGLDPENKSRIIISAKCWKPEIHRALKKFELIIQDKLDLLPDYLFQYIDFASILPQRVRVTIDPIGYEAIDFKFRLREKEITTLLMGEKLYDRKEAALRELIQNSYDTCRFKRSYEPNYVPEIIFKLTANKRQLIVQDNGMGMDKSHVEKYFTRIGSCFYKSPEFLQDNTKFTPVSIFGIGILSTFMIADTVIVETKADNSDPLMIEINNVDDYFFVKPGKLSKTGTKITLFLKKEFGKKLDLEREIRFYARHLDFPIKIILPDGAEKELSSQTPKPQIDYFIDPKTVASKPYLKKRYNFYIVNLDRPEFVANIGILCEDKGSIGLIPIERNTYINRKVGNKILVSNEGIFVNELEDILPPYFERGIFIDINFLNNSVDLNISRNAIVKNTKYEKIVDSLEASLLGHVKKWIYTIEEQPNMLLNIRYRLFQDYFHHELTEDNPKKRYSLSKDYIASNNIRDFFRELYVFHILLNGEEYSASWIDLLGISYPITIITNPPSNESYRKYLVNNSKAFLPNHIYLFGRWGTDEKVAFCSKGITTPIHIDKNSFERMIKKVVVQTSIQSIFPKTWKVVKFVNLQTNHLFVVVNRYSGFTFVNAEQKFIALLLNNPEQILSDVNKASIVEAFFQRLKRDLKTRFRDVLRKQNQILDWFVDAGVIKNKERYILKKDNFPHYYR